MARVRDEFTWCGDVVIAMYDKFYRQDSYGSSNISRDAGLFGTTLYSLYMPFIQFFVYINTDEKEHVVRKYPRDAALLDENEKIKARNAERANLREQFDRDEGLTVAYHMLAALRGDMVAGRALLREDFATLLAWRKQAWAAHRRLSKEAAAPRTAGVDQVRNAVETFAKNLDELVELPRRFFPEFKINKEQTAANRGNLQDDRNKLTWFEKRLEQHRARKVRNNVSELVKATNLSEGTVAAYLGVKGLQQYLMRRDSRLWVWTSKPDSKRLNRQAAVRGLQKLLLMYAAKCVTEKQFGESPRFVDAPDGERRERAASQFFSIYYLQNCDDERLDAMGVDQLYEQIINTIADMEKLYQSNFTCAFKGIFRKYLPLSVYLKHIKDCVGKAHKAARAERGEEETARYGAPLQEVSI